jgi:L-threonylcarbamoyladenylate synthase
VTDVRRAAELIRAGQLVAFPTETVYGLGANALDERAVRHIYEVKGRPATSPLIVHISGIQMAKTVVSSWPAEAESLASRWWPGPLTLVLPKSATIPDIVTAGLPTVGVRCPAHPIALELIREADLPVAAPSANRFGQVSPTAAHHVRLSGVAMVLDGGPCSVGIESTVLSLAEDKPVLLRPGIIPLQEIEAMIGPISTYRRESVADPSPGLQARHYSPRTPLLLVRGGALPDSGRGGHLHFDSSAPAAISFAMPQDPAGYAALLYSKLHELDMMALDWIAVELPPETPQWAGILDRLHRAAAAEAKDATS